MEAHDIFTAQVETVAVLKNPPVIVRSPYKGQITKQPHHRPQVPSRGEQLEVNAARVFIPQPNFGSTPVCPPAKLDSASPAASLSTLTSEDGKGDDDQTFVQDPSL